jgi:hypothetical protein
LEELMQMVVFSRKIYTKGSTQKQGQEDLLAATGSTGSTALTPSPFTNRPLIQISCCCSCCRHTAIAAAAAEPAHQTKERVNDIWQ